MVSNFPSNRATAMNKWMWCLEVGEVNMLLSSVIKSTFLGLLAAMLAMAEGAGLHDALSVFLICSCVVMFLCALRAGSGLHKRKLDGANATGFRLKRGREY